MKTLKWIALLVCLIMVLGCGSPVIKAGDQATKAWQKLLESIKDTMQKDRQKISNDRREWDVLKTTVFQHRAAIMQAGGCEPKPDNGNCTAEFNAVKNRNKDIRDQYDRLVRVGNSQTQLEALRPLLNEAEKLTEDFIKLLPAVQ